MKPAVTPAAKLALISSYGRKQFQGGHFRIKFRVGQDKKDQEEELRKKYPQEMYVHVCKDDQIIFGGTFPQASNFLADCKRILKMNVA